MKTSKDWAPLLAEEKRQPYFQQILSRLNELNHQGKAIYPPQSQIFEALKLTSPENLKVVILGQDPYHGINQAHGLSFSVQQGIDIPPSLANIYKELKQDLGCPIPKHGCLESWAKQGVLLLNSILTVEHGSPLAHQSLGWEIFTDKLLEIVNQNCSHAVFLLWGKNAQKKAAVIDKTKHTILLAPHPSPLSAYRGFLGCKHFSLCNKALLEHGQTEIDWTIS